MAEKEADSRVQPSRVWMLLRGMRGETQPALALALGLREAGHRVKVGCLGAAGRLFQEHGLEFEAFDSPAIRNPGNKEARRWLRKHAEALGFEGEGKEDDFMLDFLMMWSETIHRTVLEACAGGKRLAEVMAGIAMEVEKHQVLLLYDLGVDKMQDIRREFLRNLARIKKQSVPEYEASTKKRREAFRHFVKLKAEALMMDAPGLWMSFIGRMSARLQTKIAGRDRLEELFVVGRETQAFYSWQEERCDFEKFWDSWHRGSPAQEDGVGVLEAHRRAGVSCLLNSLHSLAAARPQDRPDLVIYHPCLVSTALALRARNGVRILPWWPSRPRCHAGGDIAEFNDRLREEDPLGLAPRPLRDGGPFELRALMHGSRQLITLSPLTLSGADLGGDEERRACLEACCTGTLNLEDRLRDEDPAGRLFGTTEERRVLEEFLAVDGAEPPVYVGFGSMAHPQGAQALAGIVVKLLKIVGRRGVFVSGWSGVDQEAWGQALAQEFPDGESRREAEARMLCLSAAPHEWLFPRCAALVHHGGAGTCHAALRAGVPSVVVPEAFDQFGNAEWLRSLGCGATVGRLADARPEALAVQLQVVLTDSRMKARAEELAATVRAERGLPAAVALVERCLREPEQAVGGRPRRQPCARRRKPPWRDGGYMLHGKDGSVFSKAPMQIQGGLVRDKGAVIGWLHESPREYLGRPCQCEAYWASHEQFTGFDVARAGVLTFPDGNSLRLVAPARAPSLLSQLWARHSWHLLAAPACMVLAALMCVMPGAARGPALQQP